MKIKRIGPKSLAKIAGATYAIFGLIGGVFFSLISLATLSQPNASGIPVFLGVGAVIFLPVLYGLMGFVMGAFAAWVYNIVAKRVGGIEMDVE